MKAARSLNFTLEGCKSEATDDRVRWKLEMHSRAMSGRITDAVEFLSWRTTCELWQIENGWTRALDSITASTTTVLSYSLAYQGEHDLYHSPLLPLSNTWLSVLTTRRLGFNLSDRYTSCYFHLHLTILLFIAVAFDTRLVLRTIRTKKRSLNVNLFCPTIPFVCYT